MVYYVLCMQMRGTLYTFGRNGSNKSQYVLSPVCFATFPAVVWAKLPAAHAMSGHQKVVKTALLWPLRCAFNLPTPIASSDSPELFVILSEMALGKFSRIVHRYAPIM